MTVGGEKVKYKYLEYIKEEGAEEEFKILK